MIGQAACPSTLQKVRACPLARPSSILLLDDAQRLIAKSLQPEDARLEIMRGYPQVEPKADHLRLRRQIRQARQGPPDVMMRAILVAEVMQRGGEQAVGHHQVDRSLPEPATRREAMGEFERLAEFAVVELIDAQPPQRAQQIVVVAELLGQLQRRRSRPDPPRAPCRRHTSATSRAPPTIACGSATASAALSSSLASASSVRSRHSPSSDNCTQSGTAAAVSAAPICASPSRREGPIEAGAHIVDVPAIDGEPFGLRPQFALGFRVGKEAAIISGLAARDVRKFAAGVELLQRIDARGIEQAIVRPVAANIGNDERFCHQVGEMVGDIAYRASPATAIAASSRKSPAKMPSCRSNPRLLFRKQIVAPVERRAQRLLPGQRRAPAGRQKFEPVVEKDGDLRRAEHDRARRRKLDRERDAVQPPADGGDGAEVLLVVRGSSSPAPSRGS